MSSSKHYPFKYCKRTGEGPGGDIRGKTTNYNTDRWECTCRKEPKEAGPCVGKSVCECVRREDGKKKRFEIDLANKCKYQRRYKAWVAGRKLPDDPVTASYTDPQVIRNCEGADGRETAHRRYPGLTRLQWVQRETPLYIARPQAPTPRPPLPPPPEGPWVGVRTPATPPPPAPEPRKPRKSAASRPAKRVRTVKEASVPESVQKAARRKREKEPVEGWWQ